MQSSLAITIGMLLLDTLALFEIILHLSFTQILQVRHRELTKKKNLN